MTVFIDFQSQLPILIKSQLIQKKKPLFSWLKDTYCEKRKESITFEEFEKLFQVNFYFKLGVKIP